MRSLRRLVRPWRGPGRCWVHLAFSSFFTGNCTWVHQIKPAATSSVTKMAQRTENYRHVTVQHFGTSEGQSEAEASALPEWVQIAMAKLIGMIRDQESRCHHLLLHFILCRHRPKHRPQDILQRFSLYHTLSWGEMGK